ncbi:fatty acyl-CoA reductase wat isoform X2 [Megalopta genalis]|uniref:fatty acyl-CoA reductase wat isoform X2 n=1 Tax=Megalopta genalis TaxID=115081 RepID=UPI003FD32CBB
MVILALHIKLYHIAALHSRNSVVVVHASETVTHEILAARVNQLTKGEDMAPDTNETNDTSSSPELQISCGDDRSEIAEFYDRTNVLVTGGMGFVGKLLVEKLLRSCPGIAKLYMIVRPKKGKSAEERFKENFDEPVYDRLKLERPDFMDKIVMIESDIAEEDFNVAEEVNDMLKNTNVVFHVAATVRFDEKLRLAVNTNVRVTKRLLLWAKGLPNLKAFVYVSTAYSNCPNNVIDEIHYKATIDPDDFISLANSLDNDQLEAIKSALFSKFPNNYVITKATAEAAVLKYGQDIPTGIVRPSIVLATSEEPLKAWVNNLYGSTGLAVGVGLGFVRTIYCIPEYVADLIPADYVVATIIAAGWDIANRRSLTKLEENTNLPDEEKVPVYNSVTSPQNPVTWREYMELNRDYSVQIPSIKTIWLMDTYKKLHKYARAINYFSAKQWEFRNENVRKMWGKLNSVDRKMFNFNVENIIWNDYFYHHVRGLRQYLVNDPLETVDAAIAKYNRLRIAHYTVVTLITLLVAWLTLPIVSFVWSHFPWAY